MLISWKGCVNVIIVCNGIWMIGRGLDMILVSRIEGDWCEWEMGNIMEMI